MVTDQAESGASTVFSCNHTSDDDPCPARVLYERAYEGSSSDLFGWTRFHHGWHARDATPVAIVIRDLRADLERVTAELAEAQALLDGQSDRIDALIEDTRRWQRLFAFATNSAKQARAERDATREVVEAATRAHEYGRITAELCAALARLDAPHKAADE